jgi:glycosyltransferase involved in cell wall biosynthesis
MKSKGKLQVLQICVVIPAFKVKSQILEVVKSIGPEVQKIIVVDDSCPQGSGKYLKSNINDPRVEVIFHKENLGVGGAVKTGYSRALELGAQIIVKIDGDGQMDTTRISELIEPIVKGSADYTKGNRFFDVEVVRAMPKIRIIGNLGLSFFTKLSSGYWQVFDPNNGFTAIASNELKSIPMSKIDNRYFFESDMLFRLNLAGATVEDIPMPAIYNDEKSNLKVSRVLIEFPLKHARNLVKRIAYTYYLRDFNLASIELPLGTVLLALGLGIGGFSWVTGIINQTETRPGTLILFLTCTLVGIQLLLSFFDFDINRRSK